jgi:hypothetical protein
MRGDSGFIHHGKQQSVASLPEGQQDAAMHENERASESHPSVPVGGCSLHVCQYDGEWQVWLNTCDADFTGLCVSVGRTRDIAIAEAVATLEAAVDVLQQPAPDAIAGSAK